MAKRRHRVLVALSDTEAACLNELRGTTARAVYLRRLLYQPPSPTEVLTRSEALALLSRKAREGSITAAVALERAQRAQGKVDDDINETINRILGDQEGL